MYYLKYNDIDLTQLVKVREVNLPSLPSIDHNEIEMWDMDGNLFSSLSYGNREIEISAIIQPLDPNDVETYVQDVKRAFFVREPQPIYLGDEQKYLLATPVGDIEVAELGRGTCEITVQLVAHSPYWISKSITSIDFDGKTGKVTNRGDVTTTPVISIGIAGDTTFVQLEKKNTKERILIGEMLKTGKTTVKENDTILFDNCQQLTDWSASDAGIDIGCGTGGTLAVTNDGGGICLGTVPSGSNTWKGACYRRSLGAALKDFKVRAMFSFNSSGVNGDPSINSVVDNNTGEVIGGFKEYSFQVTTKGGTLAVRDKPSSDGKVIGRYPNGFIIDGNVTIEKGWLKHTYTNGKTGYVTMSKITRLVRDNRETEKVRNYVTIKSTALRTEPLKNSKNQKTIPAGTVIRCYVDQHINGEEKFRQLNVDYKGLTGYVASEDMTMGSNIKVEYPEQNDTADDKQGIIQVYGFSSAGTQLFSLSLIDDTPWYESTYPMIKKNGVEFLADTKFTTTAPKKHRFYENETIKYEYMMGGELGYWNEFRGELYIERVKNVWYAEVQKYNGKRIRSSKVKDTNNENETLSYIVIYAGVNNADKMCAMSVDEIKVQGVNNTDPTKNNVTRFESGDLIEIDCGIPTVKVNGQERNDLVDIGSNFFDLEVGDNEIKIASDGALNFNVAFNEKYL